VEAIPRQMILDQVRAVASDFEVDAVKIGMLFDQPTIEAVAETLGEVGEARIVVDPVMVAESGAVLLDPGAKQALIELILGRAEVATPNLSEARELSGHGNSATPDELARAVKELGSRAVVVTGGHSADGADVFFDGETLESIDGPRHPDGASHGSGCTHSSALAAYLAHGFEPLAAARAAREIAAEAVANGLRELGGGTGPVDVLGVRDRSAELDQVRKQP
jgi:hydroxymethylpyrimidine/phosphomethylpyrimidine kinase